MIVVGLLSANNTRPLIIVEASTPTLIDLADVSWLWLVDLERCCSLLVGRCLGGKLRGPPISTWEIVAEEWIADPIMATGIEEYAAELSVGKHYDLFSIISSIYYQALRHIN